MNVDRIENKLDGLHDDLAGVNETLARFQTGMGALSKSVDDMRRNMVTRAECTARHNGVNRLVGRDAADRRTRLTLLLMGVGIGITAILGIINFLR